VLDELIGAHVVVVLLLCDVLAHLVYGLR
jgi:hypothetical protein